ncbi:cobalt ABC transporter ATP-binding protein [Pontibacillus halophilus JSM 076056 = DSM 19796]|uniref:Energy-coupling factor transporter ATP-binding protein EcfA2 n=1 Tax=Pontibacillus halophilus JSM 076056 = DSM 19796 TaxID=1385510 RepID=A0A0A5GEB5_9BACI|nr:energy-coupling factor ABC transporter ATP-binding protein [Pontibacillus halophilus]KGX90359.1 cobalt ABC transporter ATP-binding protein [Pontibacillus halophilus JSM 076056 = DSM 19796]
MEITFKQVGYVYQPNTPFEYTALQNLSFTIPSGSFVAVIGHTGSGKSTMLQHLNGLVTPTSGSVSIGEFTLASNTKTKNLKALRERVGVVFQYPEHQLFEETIQKDIAFGPQNFGVPAEEIERRIQHSMEAVGLSEDMKDRSPFELSGGQMRRVAIAGVLAMDPSVLVLDEPTAGLDPQGQREVMDMFSSLHHEKKLTTVLVTHSMEDALKYADYVIALDQGSLYMQGTPDEVFQQKEALNRVGLDVPEVYDFLDAVKKQLGWTIPYENQTLEQLSHQLAEKYKGGERS